VSRASIAESLLAPGALRTLFQPIFRLDALSEPSGYEALTRGPCGSTMESAAVLFEYVRLKGLEAEFDRRCIEGALAAARSLPGRAMLALNVHAATLERDAGFVEYLIESAARVEIAVSRLTLEIVERVPIHLGPRLSRAIDRLRRAGAAIAIDDFGSGQANFHLLLDLRPECLKVDRYLVHGCHSDPARCAVLRAVAGLAAGIGATTVAEGVEELEDLAMVTGLGFECAQGFLLGQPFEPLMADPLARSAPGSSKQNREESRS
jgi:EAL domain-containing protein (putative c-di-GMP-specific phosphodiesterase class I)